MKAVHTYAADHLLQTISDTKTNLTYFVVVPIIIPKLYN